jgi:hypothetical protein
VNITPEPPDTHWQSDQRLQTIRWDFTGWEFVIQMDTEHLLTHKKRCAVIDALLSWADGMLMQE